MDTNLYKEAVKEAAKGKFRGSKKLKSKYIPLYPDSSERDMRRMANAYMSIITREMKAVLPEMMSVYDQQVRSDSRMDGIADLRESVRRGFAKAMDSIAKKTEEFNLEDKLAMAATKVKNTALREWKKTISRTLNLDILDDYYNDDLYRDAIQKWVQDGSDAMRKISSTVMERMKKTIEDGYRAGKPVSEMKREIQHVYSTLKGEVASNAASSVSTLNCECVKANQEDAGVKEYVWYTRRDARVRPCHASYDGKTFRWDGPPEMWYQTKHEGKVWTGRYCHPGQDYGCRCMAVPVLDINSLNLPIVNAKKQG